MRLLLGGSPCTHWSIAQTKSRETEASGIGWELFLNYRIARDKYQPNYFLYENNKSMSPAIRAQITKELGVEPVLINSALVSAQNRQRLYWVGRRNPDGNYSTVDVSQPEDRGILLRDILESGVVWNEKAYCLTTRCQGAIPENTIQRHQHQMVAEPVRIGTIESDCKNHDHDSRQYRVYSPDGKSVTLCGNGGGVGAKTGLYAVPCAGRMVGRRINEHGHRDDYNPELEHVQRFEVNDNPQKTNCLTTVQKDNMVAVPLNPTANGKARSVTANYHKKCCSPNGLLLDAFSNRPEKQVFDFVAVRTDDGFVVTNSIDPKGKTYHIYRVEDGSITIKDKQYPIKLADGFYIIRKLTVTECKHLQTVPEWYKFPVSNTQAYKMLGNGWTADVIAHIMSHFKGITAEPVEVLGMYDGMSCGHIALDQLGATISRYYATEIDKYAINTTMHNYPDTVQLGDAFQVREDDWELNSTAEKVG